MWGKSTWVHKLRPLRERLSDSFILVVRLLKSDFLFIHSSASQPGGNVGAELKGKTGAVAFFTTVNTINVDTSRFCAALEVTETQLQSQGGHGNEEWIRKLNDTVVWNDSFRTNFPQRLPLQVNAVD